MQTHWGEYLGGEQQTSLTPGDWLAVHCPNCGMVLDWLAVHCRHCGMVLDWLAVHCRNCGMVLDWLAVHCRNCGMVFCLLFVPPLRLGQTLLTFLF